MLSLKYNVALERWAQVFSVESPCSGIVQREFSDNLHFKCYVEEHDARYIDDTEKPIVRILTEAPHSRFDALSLNAFSTTGEPSLSLKIDNSGKVSGSFNRMCFELNYAAPPKLYEDLIRMTMASGAAFDLKLEFALSTQKTQDIMRLIEQTISAHSQVYYFNAWTFALEQKIAQ
jgi:hypothetical protein